MCVIDVDVLSRYIPKEEPNLLPAVSSSNQDSFESPGEREAVLRMLLQLKQDVDYLKDVVAKAGLAKPSAPALAAPEEYAGGWQPNEQYVPVHQDTVSYDEDPEEQDFQEQEPEDMSIRSANNELIEKVLRKHGGNRKAAAAELGISERTLYRKLKQMTENDKQ